MKAKHKNYPFNFPKAVLLLGIGGIGISALAKLALCQGCSVFGIDIVPSQITKTLKKMGAKIKTGARSAFVYEHNKIDLVVYTTAAPNNHPVLQWAREKGVTIKSYPEMLGELSKQCFTIAASGMHGKSTTTSMIGIMLEHAELDPLVIVGTQVPEWEGNIRVPKGTKGGIFVVEADEYKSAMLHLKPDIIVLTRVEEDHLDYYRDIGHIKREFRKYVKKVPKEGAVVANWADENIKDIVKLPNCSIVKYNTPQDKILKQKIKGVLRVAGDHNVENALAAYKVGEWLGLDEKIILEGLAKFKGTWRRTELAGSYKLQTTNYKLPVISDYAHHPTEIKATLKALREQYPNKRLVLAYQPHQHNRTKMLFNGFVSAFDEADVLIMNEIYDVAGRKERGDENVSSKTLVSAIKKRIKNKESRIKSVDYTSTLQKTKQEILKIIKPNDILIIMGAGDIDSVARELVSFAPALSTWKTKQSNNKRLNKSKKKI